MSVAVWLDAAGRQRSPATLPGHHAGRAPGNKRRRYPVHAIADAGSAIGRCDGGGAVVVGWWGSVGRVKAGAREWELDVRAPEARPIFAQVPRAVAQTEALNRLPYADQDAIRAAWAELTNSDPDPTFRLIPPVYSDQGINIRVGRDVFINHNCTLNDIGGITFGDEVFIGPRVSLISSATPSTRRGDGLTSQLARSSSSAACGCAQARPSYKV